MKMDFKKLFGQIKNTKVLFIIFIVGTVLLLLPAGQSSEKSEKKNEDVFLNYKTELEQDLKSIISKIKGVGAVDVMVTLQDSGFVNYAKNESENSTKTDSETQKSKDLTHVLKGEGSSKETALITKMSCPSVSGVLICASGAENPQIKNDIIKATQALLGLKSHRIEVLERK